MASVKCSGCGAGIHYHGMPEGIEYIFFPISFWEILLNINCPADTLETETDYDGKYEYAWKCPKCGTFAFFDMDQYHTHVTCVYKPTNVISKTINYKKNNQIGLFFDDYLWDELTEISTLMKNIPTKYKGYLYLAKNEDEMFLFEDEEMKNCIGRYERIEIDVV